MRNTNQMTFVNTAFIPAHLHHDNVHTCRCRVGKRNAWYTLKFIVEPETRFVTNGHLPLKILTTAYYFKNVFCILPGLEVQS